jgi:hypothetical protein
MSCACLFRYKNPENHPRYKQGKYIENRCIDCNAIISSHGKRCQKCMGLSMSGKNHWNYIKGLWIKKYFCKDCKTEIDPATAIQGQKRCMKCSGKYFSAKNSWNWLGGKIKFTTRIRTNGKYKFWRKQILKRDHYKCQICNKKKNRLHAHHKIPLRSILVLYMIKTYNQFLKCKLLWDTNWGITLCQKCHNSLGILK